MMKTSCRSAALYVESHSWTQSSQSKQQSACSEANVSVPGTSNKWSEWLSESDWVLIFLHELAQQWRLQRKKIWHERSLRDEDDAWTLTTCIVHSALDCESALQHVMSVLVTALCNQPKAFGLDLGDDQSRYFCLLTISCNFCSYVSDELKLSAWTKLLDINVSDL